MDYMSFSYRKNLKYVSNQNMFSSSSFSEKKVLDANCLIEMIKKTNIPVWIPQKKNCTYRTSNGHNVDDQKKPDLTQYLLENVLECCIFLNHIECKRCQKSTITHEYQM